MKKLFSYLLLLVSFLYATSCTKKTNNTAPTTKACVFMERLEDGKLNFSSTLDANNRYSKIQFYDSGVALMAYIYEYNNGNPTKISLEVNGKITEYYTYEFNGNTLVKSHSFLFDSASNSFKAFDDIKYTYSSGKISLIETFEAGKTVAINSVTYITDAKGNVINTINGSDTTTYTGYDNKTNPHRGLIAGEVSEIYFSPNNFSSRIMYGNTDVCTYEYNSEGYPTKITTIAGGKTTVWTYEYSCK